MRWVGAFALRLQRVALACALHWVLRLYVRYFCAAAVACDSASAWLMHGIAGNLQKSADGSAGCAAASASAGLLLNWVRLLFAMGLVNCYFKW